MPLLPKGVTKTVKLVIKSHVWRRYAYLEYLLSLEGDSEEK